MNGTLRHGRFVAGLAMLAAALAGCGGGDDSNERSTPTTSGGRTTAAEELPDPGAGEVVDAEIEVDGRRRRYRLNVPSRLEPEGAALVIAMHGNGTDRNTFAEKSGLDATAEREGFLVVYPDAEASVGGVWNGGFSQKTRDIDDVKFLTELIEVIGDDYAVDPGRVFATGLSGGGMMAYRLACDAPGLVAAVAPVGATMVGDCDPEMPVSVMHVHGVDDRGIPIEGREDRDFPPVIDVVERWSAFNGCASNAQVVSDGPSTIRSWTDCEQQTAVVYYAVDSMGHEYGRADAGAPIEVRDLVSEFFTTHPRVG